MINAPKFILKNMVEAKMLKKELKMKRMKSRSTRKDKLSSEAYRRY